MERLSDRRELLSVFSAQEHQLTQQQGPMIIKVLPFVISKKLPDIPSVQKFSADPKALKLFKQSDKLEVFTGILYSVRNPVTKKKVSQYVLQGRRLGQVFTTCHVIKGRLVQSHWQENGFIGQGH